MMTSTQDKKTDPYEALASVYDAWQERYGSHAHRTLAALAPRLEEARPTIGSFLDLGCGTGSLLLLLAQKHPRWRLCGADGSAAMLAQASRKPGADDIRWYQARLTEPLPLRPIERFDAAGCFFNTLNHLLTVDELGRAFAQVNASLQPGGLFYFDLNDDRAYELGWREPHHYEDTGWAIHMDHAWDPTTRLAQARVEVTTERGRSSTTVTERCFTHDEVTAALTGARFCIEDVELTATAPRTPAITSFWTARKQLP